MMQNDISRGTDTMGGTTSNREYRDHQSNEFGSEILGLSENRKLKTTSRDQQADSEKRVKE